MNSRETQSESPEQLIKNIQKLMDEVEAIVAKSADTTGGVLSEKLEELQDRFATARERATGYYKAARRRVSEGAEYADETIRAHPYESLAVALGVGVLLGAILRRRD